MGHYTRFHFRAKLAFNLPEPIRVLLRNQFQDAQKAEEMHANLLRSEVGASAAAAAVGSTSFFKQVGDPWPGAYLYNPEWIGHPDHAFFKLDRADSIPWDNCGDKAPQPVFIEYPDGGSRIEFTCEFNHAYEEIHEFLEWIAPYVRQKYGKRNRGRDKVYVGWWSSEDMTGRVNVFIKPCATPQYPTMLFGREVVEDYSQKGTW